MTNILTFFPRHLKPRSIQRDTLLELEKRWSTANVFVINLPVASGKSAIAMTLANWQKQCSIITPTKILVNQYKNEYSYVHVLRAKKDYYCSTFRCSLDKRPQYKNLGKTCKKDLDCTGCHTYLADLRKARVMPYLLSNYHIYLAHRLYRNTLVVDEAHSLISMLKQRASKIYWQHKYNYPSNLRNREEVKQWVLRIQDTTDVNLCFLKKELTSLRPKYVVQITEDSYRNEIRPCIKLVPVDISEAPPIMWPSKVKKIILLSATLNRKDVEQLGLAGQKIQYIQASSPIHAERRPVVLPVSSRIMSVRIQDRNIEALKNYIGEQAVHRDNEKGLVHATYGLASKLKNCSWPKEIRSRLIFHDKKDKTEQYQRFRTSTEPKILVASGMYEGIDLPYDSGRWQIIAKVPWPSLGDPAISFLASQDEEWYAWEAAKTILQACGRICRTPEDFGVTFIFDKSFLRLYNNHNGLFPKWFKTGVYVNDK